MGLTIRYGLTSQARSRQRVQALVEQMRQLALDLPFETVGEVKYRGPDVCQRPLHELLDDVDAFAAVIDGCRHIPVPWRRKQSGKISVHPLEIFSFRTIPGPGSDWANFGLARYPPEIDVTYTPRYDDRFIRGHSTEFDCMRWELWLEANGHDRWEHPDDEKFWQKRKIRTGLASTWQHSSFCTTRERHGGLCVIPLLDRIAKLPTMKVQKIIRVGGK